MATHSSVLAWRIPETEEPSGLPSVGSHRVRHDWSDLAAAAAAANYVLRSAHSFVSTVIRIVHDGFHSFAQIQSPCWFCEFFHVSCWVDLLGWLPHRCVCLNKSVFQFSFMKALSPPFSILGWRLLSAPEGGHATLSWLALFPKRYVGSSLSLLLWREKSL